jgi:hypothetical protein
MGAMIEQIWIGKTSEPLRVEKLVVQIRTRSADHHIGPRLLDMPQLEA